jgi:hypothetical protein
MHRHPLNIILGRPALHLLLALAFAAAFFWPIFTMTRPMDTFHFLYSAWILSLAALFAVSRAVPVESLNALNQAAGAADDGAADSTRETF